MPAPRKSKHARRRANRRARRSPFAATCQIFRIWSDARRARYPCAGRPARDAWLRLEQMYTSTMCVAGPAAAGDAVQMIIEHSLEFGPEFSRELQNAARGLGVSVGLMRPGPGSGGLPKKRVVRTAKLGVASQLTTKRPPDTSGRLGPPRARARREVDQSRSR